MAYRDKAKKVGEEYDRILREITEADTECQNALTDAEDRERRDTARQDADARRLLEGRNA